MEGRSGPTSHDRDLGLAGQTRRADAQDDLRPRGLAGAATDAALQVGAVPMPAFLERVDRAPFVGRTGALRRLRRRWQSDLPANDGLVVVSGEPGIGKTRLVARFAAGVHAGGGLVLCGRADEESVWPYQAFVEALRHYAAHRPDVVAHARIPPAATRALAMLVPELAPPGAAERPAHSDGGDGNRHQLVEGVVRLLLHAARAEGLLLVLEDLHWADPPTTLLLRHVLRRSEGSRLLVVATLDDRHPGAGHALDDLRGDGDLDDIQLVGLRPDEAAGLIAARTGQPAADDESTRRLCGKAGGNPFFIEELLRSSHPESDADARVPVAIKRVIGQRLEHLPPMFLETLTLAAVLGNDFSLKVLEAVAPEQEQDELIDALEGAVSAGLIVEDLEEVDRFSFSHSLVRQTLYERPIASRRLRLHRRIAEALEISPLPVHPAELAHHYFEARAVGGADKAIVFGLQAGAAAQMAHAYEAAVEHYERVLGLLPLVGRDDPAARCDLLLALGAVRWQASEPDPRSTFARALELARELGSADRLARAALGAGGRFYAPVATDSPYTDLLDDVLATLGPDDRALTVRVQARLAENLVLAQPAQALELADKALGMARRLGEPTSLAAALMGRHAALLHVEHAAERVRIGEEAIAVAGELEDAELAALARHWLLYDLAELGEFEQAHRRHIELERIAAELQQPLYRHSALAWRAVWTGIAGRFDEAEQLARDSLRLAEGARAPDAQTHFTAQLVAIRREQGRLDELLPEIERLAGGDAYSAVWRSLVPLAHLDAGDRARARETFRDAVDSATQTCTRTMLWLTATGSLCEVAAELGDADVAERLYAELAPYGDRLVQWSFTGNAGSVRRLLGRAAAVTGRMDAARDHYEAGLVRHTELEAPALLARTRCDYGEFLLHTQQPGAHRLLLQAATAARSLGMTGIAARAARHA